MPLSAGVGRHQERWGLTVGTDEAAVLTQFAEACLTTTVVYEPAP
ncbi:hypothetical protein [Streptomyces sp. NPDC001970]